jgi:hypothetical protein
VVGCQHDSIGANKQLFIGPDAFIYRLNREEVAVFAVDRKIEAS